MKHKENYEKKERKKMDPQSKLKAYEKKKRKIYRSFYISKQKDN